MAHLNGTNELEIMCWRPGSGRLMINDLQVSGYDILQDLMREDK